MTDIALSQVLAGLSYALDVTEGEPPGHAVRTLVIGMRLAQELALGEADRSALFYGLMLKDAGCSANASRLSALFQAPDQDAKRAMKTVDWSRKGALAAYTWRAIEPGGSPLRKARRMRAITRESEVTRSMIATRCEMGARIAGMLELPGATAAAIRALDEHWDGSGYPLGLRGEEIPLLGRILCLAQTVEVFVRAAGVSEALEVVLERRGSWFDPALVDRLVALRDDTAFWAPLEDPQAVPPPAPWEPEDRVLYADEDRLDSIAEAFAHVIDAKTPSTARHSEGVAGFAAAIGVQLGVGELATRDLLRAGLLHDIGKLTVPSGILEKPGTLDPDEWAVVRRHPEWTERILARVPAFASFAEDAAAHHERLDGRGYHRGLTAAELRRPARILAVADVYDALTADRPYRGPMPVDQALSILHEQRGDALDPDCVDALEAVVRSGRAAVAT